MNVAVQQAVSALGESPLQEAAIQRHIAPLFSRVLASERVYLANHSLGRPLDAMAEDVSEAIALWYGQLGDAWDAWLDERHPSDQICPSCGIQFGYDDAVGGDLAARAFVYRDWREAWRERGCPWASTGHEPPQGWDPQQQILRVE